MEKYLYLKDVLNYKKFNLSLVKSSLEIINFPFELFNVIEKKEDEIRLNTILNIIVGLLNKTEGTLITNINFENIPNINNGGIRFKNLEKILFILYSSALKSNFIENKNFFINFPQLKTLKNENHEFESFSIDMKNTATYKLILEDPIKFDLKQLIDKYHKISSTPDDVLIFSHKTVALGGSFDHLHLGHNILLNTALLLTKEKLLIGITSDRMISKKAHKYLLQPYELRRENVLDALIKMGLSSELDIFELDDPVGKAGTDENLDLLVLTPETFQGGEYVNNIRKNNNLLPANLYVTCLIECEIDEKINLCDKVSSSHCRNKMLLKVKDTIFESLLNKWNDS